MTTKTLSAESRTYLKGYETGGKMVNGHTVLLPHGEPALETYLDSVHIPTIGWGHTGLLRGVKLELGMTITREEAEELLSADLLDAETTVNKRTFDVPTNQNQFDAMVILTFNIGDGAFIHSSVLKAHRAGNYTVAAADFLLWNKVKVDGTVRAVGGLTKRRGEEKVLYLKPMPSDVAEKLTGDPNASVATVAAAADRAPPEGEDVKEPVQISTVSGDQRVTPEQPASLAKSKTIIGSIVASLTAVPVTVSGISTATDTVKQIKEQADQLQQLAWFSTALGFIVFALSTYLILKRLSDRKAGIK